MDKTPLGFLKVRLPIGRPGTAPTRYTPPGLLPRKPIHTVGFSPPFGAPLPKAFQPHQRRDTPASVSHRLIRAAVSPHPATIFPPPGQERASPAPPHAHRLANCALHPGGPVPTWQQTDGGSGKERLDSGGASPKPPCSSRGHVPPPRNFSTPRIRTAILRFCFIFFFLQYLSFPFHPSTSLCPRVPAKYGLKCVHHFPHASSPFRLSVH